MTQVGKKKTTTQQQQTKNADCHFTEEHAKNRRSQRLCHGE